MLKLLHRTFAHGIHPPEHKHTADRAIRRFPFAPRLSMPLSQHIGQPALACVHVGQEVVRGEPIATAAGFLSVPIHAPATGVITAIEVVVDARGGKAPAIVIAPYPGDDQRLRYGAPRDVAALTRKELIGAIQDTGLVGLGGAGFPTHAKLAVRDDQHIDTLVVNGCECEPYLTNDARVMVEWVDDLLRGIDIALRACGARHAVIGVEDNKPRAIAALRAHLPADGRVTVEPVATKYPQGAGNLLIKTLLGREVPSGALSYEVGVVVQNIATLAELGQLLPQQRGLIERVVTVSGELRHPGNYLVPLGTPLRYLLDQAGYSGGDGEIILGGPMMGTSVASLDVPVTKTVSGILALAADGHPAGDTRVYPCIQCGKCLAACPMNLNPSRLGLLAAKREYRIMAERYHLGDCFECGACAYVCPSRIPLVQYCRIAKQANREASA
jgi:electron transport complex protein RnfC